MSLIKWNSEVEVSYQDKDDEQQALMLMLSRDYSSISQWQGKLTKTKLFLGTKEISVQVRKQIHGTNILIDIGIKNEMHNKFGRLDKESLVAISASGKMNYTIDEITELNLVIKEAYGVYCNLTEKQKCTQPTTPNE
jgi:hypothetical protein